MALTDAAIRGFKPMGKPYKRADAKGLYLEIFPNGSKLWRFKYRISGKEKRLALGAYPEIKLSDARKRLDEARSMVEDGLDPSIDRKRKKAAATISANDSFEHIASEYIEKMEREGKAPSTIAKAQWFLSHLKPAIGTMPISEVDPQLLLAALKKLEAKGNYESAKKTRSFASRVFRYAVATGRSKSDPAILLSGALTTKKARHYAAILEPAKLGELLRAIDGYTGGPVSKLALQIAPHVFVRPGELRYAEWDQFDLEERVWRIPAERMKARKPHAVPLSDQVVTHLIELRTLTGPKGFAFPAAHTSLRPMSENTLNAAFRRMGFTKDEVTSHGLRSTASTLLNESGLWHADAIERALAHGHSDAVRGTYARGQHWDERVKMMQWWSDYLDAVKEGGAVIPIEFHKKLK